MARFRAPQPVRGSHCDCREVTDGEDSRFAGSGRWVRWNPDCGIIQYWPVPLFHSDLMTRTTEAFSRVRIDALLVDAGWNPTDGTSVLFEHALPDGPRADYVLCDRAGRPMAVVEAKRASVEPIAAQDQGRHYAALLRSWSA